MVAAGCGGEATLVIDGPPMVAAGRGGVATPVVAGAALVSNDGGRICQFQALSRPNEIISCRVRDEFWVGECVLSLVAVKEVSLI